MTTLVTSDLVDGANLHLNGGWMHTEPAPQLLAVVRYNHRIMFTTYFNTRI